MTPQLTDHALARVQELKRDIDRLVSDRHSLRESGASVEDLESNRQLLAGSHHQLSLALIAAYL